MSVRYLLDSDICIYVTKRRAPAILKRFDAFAPVCGLSAVAYGELCYGAAKSSRPIEAAANLAILRIKGAGDRKGAEALKAEFVDAPGNFANLKNIIAERWLRSPKASFVYSVEM